MAVVVFRLPLFELLMVARTLVLVSPLRIVTTVAALGSPPISFEMIPALEAIADANPPAEDVAVP